MKKEEFDKKYPKDWFADLEENCVQSSEIECPYCKKYNKDPEIIAGDHNFKEAHFAKCFHCSEIFKWEVDILEVFDFSCEKIEE